GTVLELAFLVLARVGIGQELDIGGRLAVGRFDDAGDFRGRAQIDVFKERPAAHLLVLLDHGERVPEAAARGVATGFHVQLDIEIALSGLLGRDGKRIFTLRIGLVLGFLNDLLVLRIAISRAAYGHRRVGDVLAGVLIENAAVVLDWLAFRFIFGGLLF